MFKTTNFLLILLTLLQLTCHPEKSEDSVIVKPKLLSIEESLKYPAEAFNKGIEGKVFIRFLVNTEGNVIEAKVLKSSGSEILDEAALKMVRSSVYESGTVNGVASEFWIHTPVQFKLDADNEIIDDIGEWREQALTYQKEIRSDTGLQKSELYKVLFYHYQTLARDISDTRTKKANETILSIVEKSISNPWNKYEDTWPLGFLLFQDYIKRYPESEYSSKSRTALIKHLQREIEMLEQKSISESPYAAIYSLISEYLKELYDQDLQ